MQVKSWITCKEKKEGNDDIGDFQINVKDCLIFFFCQDDKVVISPTNKMKTLGRKIHFKIFQ